QRRPVRLRERLGVQRSGPTADAVQGTARVRDGQAEREELQIAMPSENITAKAEGITGQGPAQPATGNGQVAAGRMNLTLHVWRQKGPNDRGRMVTYQAKDVLPAMSFLEMLDVVNQELVEKGEEPIAFDHDCREGICGSCSLMINGRAHGPERGVASCQTYL